MGITDPRRLARWHGQVSGDLRPGGEFRIYNEASDLDSAGRVEACDPPRLLRVTSRETDESYRKGNGVPPFDEILEATLTADGDQTVLVIEVRGMPLDKIAFYGAGWQIHLRGRVADPRRVYSLRPEPFAEVDEWLGRYRALWEQRLDALHAEVARGRRERRSSR